MKKLLHFSFILLIFNVYVYAYRWPNQDSQIFENFGQKISLNDVQRGLRLTTQLKKISFIDQGDVLFYQNTKSLLPSRSSGNLLIGHKDDLYSVYTNIESVDINKEAGEQIVYLSDSIESEIQYSLYLYDTKIKQYVNPAVFLPLGRSGGRVVIDRLIAKYENGAEYVLYDGIFLPSGLVTLYIDGYSIDSRGRRIAPKNFTLQVLGNNLAQVGFDSISGDSGSIYLVPSEGMPILLKNLYNDQGLLYLTQTQLREGQLNMVAKVANLDGQMQERTIRVRVVHVN